MMRATFAVGLFLISLVRSSFGAGNVTCASDALDWYTDVVGETPCTLVVVIIVLRSLIIIYRPTFRHDLPTVTTDMQQPMYASACLSPLQFEGIHGLPQMKCRPCVPRLQETSAMTSSVRSRLTLHIAYAT